MKTSLNVAIATAFWLFGTTVSQAATFSELNTSVVKFGANTTETELIGLGAAKVTLGSTSIYIGTNQVSSNNQDPIVISFTNGIRDWVRSYDTSPVDGRGVGLLWDEASANLYGVFTADGGSTGSGSFSAATQGGWLSSYGRGGGSLASVLLKLNPNSGNAEAGTYLKAQLTSGNTNTLVPTDLDFVNGEVVFYGNSFFTPLDIDGSPFEEKTSDAGSPFPYRLILTADLSTATGAEAIGWNGVTQFSPLVRDEVPEEPDPGDVTNPDDVTGEDPDPGDVMNPDGSTGEDTGDDGPGETPDTGGEEPGGGGIIGDIEDGEAAESVPEPGLILGLGMFGIVAWWLRRGQRSPIQPANH